MTTVPALTCTASPAGEDGAYSTLCAELSYTAEVETFRHALTEVRKRFYLGRVILVADPGMVSERILREIEEAGLEYIVGVRMRKLNQAGEVLSRAGRYREVSKNSRSRKSSTKAGATSSA